MKKPFEPGRWRSLFHTREGLFPPTVLQTAASFVREHPLLAGTTLNARFSGTLGFSIALTRSGFPRLEKNFPFFHSYMETVAPDCCNAFFINPLVIAEGSQVAPHIDRSLGSWCRPDAAPYPRKVSVLYLEVPDDLEGGRLLLHPPAWTLRAKPAIVPRTGLLFEFRGDLKHEVAAVTRARHPRISLVMEHYELPPYLLRKIPDFFVRSKRTFDSFMDDALGQGLEEAGDGQVEEDRAEESSFETEPLIVEPIVERAESRDSLPSTPPCDSAPPT